MGKVIRRARGETQKNIIRRLDELSGRYSLWEVWQDFVIMSAISIANLIHGPYRDAREKEYLARAGKYSAGEIRLFAEMLSEVVAALERNPDQDFLGELFMALELGNEWDADGYALCAHGRDEKTKVLDHKSVFLTGIGEVNVGA